MVCSSCEGPAEIQFVERRLAAIIEAAHKKIVERGYTEKAEPSIGRDGRWLMHVYDKDFTRTEFMIRKPVKEPCCFPLTDVIGK